MLKSLHKSTILFSPFLCSFLEAKKFNPSVSYLVMNQHRDMSISIIFIPCICLLSVHIGICSKCNKYWSGTPNHYLTMCNKSTHFDWLSCSCSQLKCRLSKTIPMKVTDFLKFINHRTGALHRFCIVYGPPQWAHSIHLPMLHGTSQYPFLCHQKASFAHWICSLCRDDHRQTLQSMLSMMSDGPMYHSST